MGILRAVVFALFLVLLRSPRATKTTANAFFFDGT